MVVDYEQAWIRLGQLVAGKTQHGRGELLLAMAEVAAECQVPAGELSRLLRLYGVEVERARSIEAETDRTELDAQRRRAFDDGLGLPSDPELAGHHGPIGGHDGSRSEGSNGRRHG